MPINRGGALSGGRYGRVNAMCHGPDRSEHLWGLADAMKALTYSSLLLRFLMLTSVSSSSNKIEALKVLSDAFLNQA